MTNKEDAEHKLIGLQIESAQRILGSIGWFIQAFSRSELTLYKVLLRYAKVTDAVGRAIFSGIRARTMIEHIRGIAANTNMSNARIADLEEIFTQFTAINSMRDDIVHHRIGGFSVTGTTISTHERQSRYAKSKVITVTYEMMQAMTADLSQIGLRLVSHLGKGAFRPTPQRMRSPWLYKFPQPAKTQGKSLAGLRKRSRRPRSSQE